MLPEDDVERVRDYCQSRVPDHVLDQLRVEMDTERLALTILECRPPWREDLGPAWTRHPVARLRYTMKTRLWTLYSRDRHGTWHRYPFVPAARTVVPLLEEVERDPTCIFWG